MWCPHCRQDVPHHSSGQQAAAKCFRCGGTLGVVNAAAGLTSASMTGINSPAELPALRETGRWNTRLSTAQRLVNTADQLLAGDEDNSWHLDLGARSGRQPAACDSDAQIRADRPTKHRRRFKKTHLLGVSLAGFTVMLAAIITSAAISLDKLDRHYAIGLGCLVCVMTGMTLTLWQKNEELQREVEKTMNDER